MKPFTTRTSLILALACNFSMLTISAVQAESPKGKKPAAEEKAKDDDEAVKEPTVEDYKKVATDLAGNMEKAATILETVKDTASAKTASVRLTKTSKDLKGIIARMKAMGDPDEEMEKKLKEDDKVKTVGEAAGKHFQEAIDVYIKADPEAMEAVKASFEEYGKTLQSLGGGAAKGDAAEGKKDKVMELSEALLDNMDGAADILESVEDKATAKQAAKDLTEAGEEMKALVAELKALGELSEEDQKALAADDTLTKKGADVSKHFTEAAQGLQELEDKAAAKLVAPALIEYGKIASSIPGAGGK